MKRICFMPDSFLFRVFGKFLSSDAVIKVTQHWTNQMQKRLQKTGYDFCSPFFPSTLRLELTNEYSFFLFNTTIKPTKNTRTFHTPIGLALYESLIPA